MKKFSWKKWLNGVIVIPEDTREVVKYILALVISLLVSYGFEVNETMTILIGIIIKALLDRLHFWLNNEYV
jgi:hypothetical protein